MSLATFEAYVENNDDIRLALDLPVSSEPDQRLMDELYEAEYRISQQVIRNELTPEQAVGILADYVKMTYGVKSIDVDTFLASFNA